MDEINMFELGQRSARAETAESAAADHKRFESYLFTVGMLCGGILQLADIGLNLCSQNVAVPDSCRELATDHTPYAKYYVGRTVHGLPAGAYVHAGRNQFAHWTDEKVFDSSDTRRPAGFSQFTDFVFRHLALAHSDDIFMDLVFELGNPFYRSTPLRSAEIVLTILEWNDYETYEREMASMLPDQRGR